MWRVADLVTSAAADRRRGWALLALLAATPGCGGSPTAPVAFATALHAEAADPAGDAAVDARVPTAPDLVQATADVANGTVTFVVHFAAGTLDRQNTRVAILLDTDQSAATGISQVDGLAADYGIDIALATGLATITKADAAGCAARQSCFTPVGTASITLLTDAVQVGVPLSLLGSADGRMTFQVSSYVLVAPLTPVVFDYLPDNRLPPVRLQ